MTRVGKEPLGSMNVHSRDIFLQAAETERPASDPARVASGMAREMAPSFGGDDGGEGSGEGSGEGGVSGKRDRRLLAERRESHSNHRSMPSEKRPEPPGLAALPCELLPHRDSCAIGTTVDESGEAGIGGRGGAGANGTRAIGAVGMVGTIAAGATAAVGSGQRGCGKLRDGPKSVGDSSSSRDALRC